MLSTRDSLYIQGHTVAGSEELSNSQGQEVEQWFSKAPGERPGELFFHMYRVSVGKMKFWRSVDLEIIMVVMD